jgi:hypothetical protein
MLSMQVLLDHTRMCHLMPLDVLKHVMNKDWYIYFASFALLTAVPKVNGVRSSRATEGILL